jgi:hypothetical protein
MDAGPLVKFCFPKKRLKSVVYKKRQSAYLFRTVNHFISITSLKRSFRLAAAFLALFCGLGTNAHAAVIQLFFYVELNQLVKDDGVTPLADGSIIQIIQSGADGLANGFQQYGNDYLLDTTTGDDVILATIQSGFNGSEPLSPGNFFVYLEVPSLGFDLSNTYFYIRFFDFPLSNVGNLLGVSSNLYWGQSSLFLASDFDDPFLGTIEIEFAPSGDLEASNNDSFTVIPEPSTMSFFALMGGMVVAMRNQMIRRKRRQQREAAQAADESPTG